MAERIGLAASVLALGAVPAFAQSGGGENLALNSSGAGQPSPVESDPGWGGGSFPWQMIDGVRSPADWRHGLAFTGGRGSWAGEACGPRQATIDFGSAQSFNRVVIWHHGDEHIPAEAAVSYWDGSAWSALSPTRVAGAVRDTTGYIGISDEYSFPAVEGSKVRYSFDNCGLNTSGVQNEHGWIYEFEVYVATAGSGGSSDPTHVEIIGGSLTVGQPMVGDFEPVTLTGSAQDTSASMDPFDVVDATGTGAGWALTVQATRFAEVDSAGAYVDGGRTLPAESLSMAAPTVSAEGTSSPPPSVAPGPYLIDGAGAVSLLSAATDAGMGRFVVAPGGLTLSVPGDAYARTYRSDLTLSLVSGP